MSKTYVVYLPFTGVLAVSGVEADSEKEAMSSVWGYIEDLRLRAIGGDDLDHVNAEVDEWEPVEHVTKGNVFYGVQNSIDAQEEKGE